VGDTGFEPVTSAMCNMLSYVDGFDMKKAFL